MNSAESGLHQLFKAQAAETSDTPAIVFGAEQTSYAQLDQATDALGAYLGRLPWAPTSGVAAFMPVALDLPDSLLGTLVSESQPKVMITKARHLP